MNTRLNNQLSRSRAASRVLAQIPTDKKNAVLRALAKTLRVHSKEILAANTRDLKRRGEDYPLRDRLLLTEDRLKGIIGSLRTVVGLPDPIGELLEKRTLPNKLKLSRVRTPLGVVGVIYEARPNVTIEIVSLTLKTGNATILKGGEDAHGTNVMLVRLIRKVLKSRGLPEDAVVMIDSFDRRISDALMQADDYVDLLIPRGGDRLIQYVRKNSTVPVIETGAGVCHTYVEKTANLAYAVDIVENAKTRRPSVCNALDTVVVDAAVAQKFLEKLAPRLEVHQVEVFADPRSYAVLTKVYPSKLLKKAKPKDFGREFLSLKCSIKVVKNAAEAIDFIQERTSGHSEAIVTENQKIARTFTDVIDASSVYVNASTAFTDGFEFGLGAEIGISTQKLHARGPMALRELTSYKWVIIGQGQVRSAS